VLETFEGFVDQIVGDVAHVTLTSEYGDTLYGEYLAADLACKGIEERSRFKVVTVEVNGTVRVDIEPIPDRELTADEERAIQEEIEQQLGTDEPDNDY
jgi:hypothetical protein